MNCRCYRRYNGLRYYCEQDVPGHRFHVATIINNFAITQQVSWCKK